MSLVDGVRHRLRVLFRGEAYAKDIQRELSFHVELDALARAGDRSAYDAEVAARRHLGNATYYREEVRSVTPLRWLDRIRQDSAYAWRGFMRTPAFTATLVATLGLGIGVNAAMFSFIDQLFLRPPAGVPAPDAVRRLYTRTPRLVSGVSNGVFPYWNYPRFAAVQNRVGDSIPVAVYSPSSGRILRMGEATDSTRISYVGKHFFLILGLRPTLGRFFAADEHNLDAPSPVAVISDALWRRDFGASPSVLGRAIVLNKQRLTVIGVAPPGFAGINVNLTEVWAPLNMFDVEGRDGQPWYVSNWGNYFLAIGSVASPALEPRFAGAATAALRTVRDYGRDPDTTVTFLTGPIVEARGPTRAESAVQVSTRVAAVALIVLVIACANVANMLLLRATSRRREIAVRRALGGSRARLYSQVLTESTLLGLMSGAVALAFALWAGAAVRRLVLPTVHWSTTAVDVRVAIGTMAVAFAVGFAAGLVPAAFTLGIDLADALKAGVTHRRTRTHLSQSTLLLIQTALSVVLLVTAGLFVRSLVNVRDIDLGYDPEGLVTATTWNQQEARTDVGAELPLIAARMRGRPGVIAASVSQTTPLTGWGITKLFVPGNDSAVRFAHNLPTNLYTGPGFFATTGVRLVAGRDFTDSDRVGAAAVMVIDEMIARSLWPGESAIGKCLKVGKTTSACSTVVGVVEPVHRSKIIESVGPQFYLPVAQGEGSAPTAIAVRVQPGAVASTSAALRSELQSLYSDHSLFSVRTLDEITANEVRPWRMGALLFSGLGLLAVLVASIGIYGVVAYATAQRTHEMGVRIALGAQAKQIIDLVLGTNLRVVFMGLALGIIVALMLGRFVASLLFGVVPNDLSVMIASAVTMFAVAGLATFIPGWRATRINPVEALRAD